jgi:hypothetical protein
MALMRKALMFAIFALGLVLVVRWRRAGITAGSVDDGGVGRTVTDYDAAGQKLGARRVWKTYSYDDKGQETGVEVHSKPVD